ncbi:MAG: hypothetical protein ACQEP1_03700 [Nanobdellota archaeon]
MVFRLLRLTNSKTSLYKMNRWMNRQDLNNRNRQTSLYKMNRWDDLRF